MSCTAHTTTCTIAHHQFCHHHRVTCDGWPFPTLVAVACLDASRTDIICIRLDSLKLVIYKYKYKRGTTIIIIPQIGP